MIDGLTTAGAVRQFDHFIDGSWVAPVLPRWFEDRDPLSGTVIARAAAGGRDDAARAVAAAQQAFPLWSGLAPSSKQRLFLRAADIVEARHGEIVELLATETGAGRAFAEGQLGRVVNEMRQASAWVYQPHGETIPSDVPGSTHMALRRPLGVVAGITPWNGAQIVGWRTVVPPLAFGNTIVLKPSEHAPITSGLLIAEILEEAGFPAGVVNVVTHAPGEAQPIADELVENDAVRCLNFTGSTRTGRRLAQAAGERLKRVVLELGGYNTLIVLADADLEYAARAVAFGAFLHQGQVCLNTRKVIVEAPALERFLELLVARTEALAIGDPRDERVMIGPIITPEALASITDGVEQAVADGARVLTGARTEGSCFAPTVLVDVPPHADVYREELFGPVLVVESAPTSAQAIEIASQLQAGAVHVNDQTMNDEAQMPVGGVRDSGWGRAGPHSVEDFTSIQWVSLQSVKREFPS